MKITVKLSSDHGKVWTAEAKDLGLSAFGDSIMSALDAIMILIQDFFVQGFGTSKPVEIGCQKITGSTQITVIPVEERPETPLTEYIVEEAEEDRNNLISTDEPLLLESGEVQAQAEASE